MKRIIEECNTIDSIGPNSQEGVKLRLRGKGSGFLEGPEQRESEDPLNLCVSSKDKEKYDHACDEVEKLLVKVYQDYRGFDKSKLGKPADHGANFAVKKEETITGPKSMFE